MDILIFDTGVAREYKSECNKIYRINPESGFDDIGHGTAVLSIIDARVTNQNIFVYKCTSLDNPDTFASQLLKATSYKKFRFVNLSLGVSLDPQNKLLSAINEIQTATCTIICAADNGGAVSFPAYYDETVSIEWSRSCISVNDFVINPPEAAVTLSGYGGKISVWGPQGRHQGQGASYLAPIFLAKAVNHQSDWSVKRLGCSAPQTDRVKMWARRNYSKVQIATVKTNGASYKQVGRSAIIMPCNKEVQTLVNNADQMRCEISGVFDLPFGKNIENKLTSLQYRSVDSKILIHSMDNIDWSSPNFDSVILGHVRVASRLLGRDLVNEIEQQCLKFNKRFYSFDLISEEEKPNLLIGNRLYEGALYRFSTPSVAVVGTKPKIGKASLQLGLARSLREAGYKVASFMTEPYYDLIINGSGWVNGYNSSLCGWRNEIKAVNKKMKAIDDSDVDLVIVGTQSQVLAENFDNIGAIPQETLDVLMGARPDAFVLVKEYGESAQKTNRIRNFLTTYFCVPVIGEYSYDPRFASYPTAEVLKLSHSIIKHFSEGEYENYDQISSEKR